MRRFLALIAIPLLACVVLAGCGGSSKSTASSSSSASSSPGSNTAVTATGAFDKTPKVTIPKTKPGSSLTVRTLIQGSGTALTKLQAGDIGKAMAKQPGCKKATATPSSGTGGNAA